jgi:hypothetical protein
MKRFLHAVGAKADMPGLKKKLIAYVEGALKYLCAL